MGCGCEDGKECPCEDTKWDAAWNIARKIAIKFSAPELKPILNFLNSGEKMILGNLTKKVYR
jgi:hypothetical protein